jgi:hypothetical protein
MGEADDESICLVRNGNKENVPFMVNKTIDKKYKDFTVSKVEELVTPADLSYLFSVENEKLRILLRVYSNGVSYEIKKKKEKLLLPLFIAGSMLVTGYVPCRVVAEYQPAPGMVLITGFIANLTGNHSYYSFVWVTSKLII